MLSRDGVVSIVTDLRAGQSGVRNPEVIIFLRNVQNGSGAHPASYSTATAVLSPRVKRPGLKLTAHLYLAPNNEWSYTSTPPICLHSETWAKFPFTFTCYKTIHSTLRQFREALRAFVRKLPTAGSKPR
jgi:hypothetical protein